MATLDEMFPEWGDQTGDFEVMLEAEHFDVLRDAARENIEFCQRRLLQVHGSDESVAKLTQTHITLRGVDYIVPRIREFLMEYLLRTDEVTQELGWAGKIDEAFARADAGHKAPEVYHSIRLGIAAAALSGTA